MGRTPCCDKNNGLKKGPWTTEEDQKLIDYIKKHGYGNWRTLPKNAGLQRCGKSCRLRWTNYLRPDIKRGRFSFEEEETIIQLHSILGNKWSAIASRLPGRTDNEIKNYWNTHIRKRLLKMGIDPVTHTPRLDLLLDLSNSFLCSSLEIMNIQNLLGIQQMNPELLKLASSFISSQQHAQENIHQSCNTTIHNQVPRFDSVSNSLPTQQHFGEPDIKALKVENPYPNINVDSSYSSSFNNPNYYQNGFGITDYDHIPQLSSYNNYYSSSNNIDDQNLMYQYQTSTYGNNQYLSTPSSSSPTPLNSNSTHVTEDEREISYVSSSNRLQFEIIPDILDANEFM